MSIDSMGLFGHPGRVEVFAGRMFSGKPDLIGDKRAARTAGYRWPFSADADTDLRLEALGLTAGFASTLRSRWCSGHEHRYRT